MPDKINGNPQTITPAAAMQADLVLVMREIERRYEGAAHVTLILSAPGAAQQSAPEFSHVTTAPDDDLRAVMTAYMTERGWNGA